MTPPSKVGLDFVDEEEDEEEEGFFVPLIFPEATPVLLLSAIVVTPFNYRLVTYNISCRI
jgi:hypothetical protein